LAGSALLQPARSVCVSPRAFSFLLFLLPKKQETTHYLFKSLRNKKLRRGRLVRDGDATVGSAYGSPTPKVIRACYRNSSLGMQSVSAQGYRTRPTHGANQIKSN